MLLRFFRKHIVHIILILTCILTSCSQNPIKNNSNKPVLKLNLIDDPLSWDPRCVRLIKDVTLSSHLFEGITRRNKDGKIEYSLAEKILISDDKKTYTIYLKEAYWSNGEKIIAQDFRSSWLQVLQPDFPSFYSHFMDLIKNSKQIKQQLLSEDNFGVKVISDKILTVELEKPYSYFEEMLSLPIFFPVHESLRIKGFYEKDFPLISNGAFTLSHWQPKFSIKLEKNPYYWEKDAVFLEEINMSIITDNATEVLLFEKEQLNWLGQPWSSSILFEAREKLQKKGLLKSYDVLGTFWLLLNTETFPLNNKKLRQALSLAINKEAIIKYILKGNQLEATSVLPKSLSSLPKDLLDTQTNLILARKLFQEALEELNLTAQTLPKITLTYPSISRCTAIVQEIQQQWKKHLNISIDLQGYEYRLFLDQRNQGTYQIATADWISDYSDPLSFLQILSSNNSLKYVQWNNPIFSKLIEEAHIEINDLKRNQLIQKAEKILSIEVPVLPLYHHSFDYALSKNITGVIFYSSGVVDLKYAKLE